MLLNKQLISELRLVGVLLLSELLIFHDILTYPAIKVTIEINYTSPDTFPVYSPPNYRASSGPVTLRCVATGTTNQTTYQWSTTCRRCLYHTDSSQSTITEPFLSSADAGTYTCTVRDGNGIIGSASTDMNIIGLLCSMV